MTQKFKATFKILMITILFFLVIDLLIGKNFYKKFIRKSFTDVDTVATIPDKFYDHKFKKNFKTKNMGWGKRRYSFCTDENGFRTFCDSQFKNEKNFDIGFIGDSFTESIGIEYDKAFVGLISLKLNSKKIANLAVASYSPSIYYAKIKKLLSEDYTFDEIIVFLDVSDLHDDNVCYELKKNKVVRRPPPKNHAECRYENHDLNEKILMFMNKRLKMSYELLLLVNTKLEEYGIKDQKIKNWVTNNPRSNWTFKYNKKIYNNLTLNQATAISLSNMKKLSVLLEKNNIKLSVAVYPWPGTLKYDTQDNLQLKIWKKFCQNRCSNFYNFMKPFFKILQENNFDYVYNNFYIKNDIHFNEKGNEIIADNFILNYKN